MQIDTMLAEGLQLLVLGMGTVFFILVLLIFCLSLLPYLMSPSTNESESVVIESMSADSKSKASPSSSVGVIAAIQAAVHCYRSSPNR